MRRKILPWILIITMVISMSFVMPLTAGAAAEASVINRTPFQFPLSNMYENISEESDFYSYTINSSTGSVKVDGDISEVSAKTPFMDEYVVPASGHPAGTIFTWVMNDDENLYVSFDVTPDNTMDGNEDYVKVYTHTNAGVKVFKVSMLDSAWGMPGFTTTERANYQHKVYELAIPLNEIGISSEYNGDIRLAFSAYGTMAAPLPVSFRAAVEYYSGGQPAGISNGHFNNDSFLDIVSINSNNDNLAILLGNGDGTFEERIVVPAGYAPAWVETEDFNGDSYDDLVITRNSGIAVLIANGDGTFTPPVAYGTGGQSASSVIIADFNNDGKNDLAASSDNANKVFLFIGNGDGTFNPGAEMSITKSGRMIAEDFNNDVKLDLAVVCGDRFTASTLEVFLGDGEGALTHLKTLSNIGDTIGFGYSTSGATAADFNGDNFIDIAIAYFDDSLDFSDYDEYVSILLGDGAGDFSYPNPAWADFPLNLGPIDAVVGDFNNDAYVDLAVSNRYSKNISILPNLWHNTLSNKQDFGLNVQPLFMTTGDFNNDSKLDLAFTADNGNVSVLINNTGDETTTYTVTFDKNGGDTEASPQTRDVVSPATTVSALPSEPTRDSFAFEGWWTGNGVADDGIGADGEDGWGTEFTATTDVTDNLTVYAKWGTSILLSDATLSSLSASDITLTPDYNSETTSYNASVNNSISSTTIMVVPSNPLSTVKINGTTGTSLIVNLAVGSNIITIDVTAEDGIHTKTYILTINRAGAPNNGGGSGGSSDPILQPVKITRFGGLDRFATSLAIAESLYNGPINNCILTTGFNFPDALSGSALSKKLNAPLLICGNSSKDSKDVIRYIETHLTKDGTLYILGGPGAVKEEILDALKNMGVQNILRLAGQNRYNTNLEVLKQLNIQKGTPVIITTGENYPDSLSIGPIAASLGYPVLLSSRDSLNQASEDFLRDIAPSKIYIVGGTGAISDTLVQKLQELTQLPSGSITRIQGLNRFETALNIAKHFNLYSAKILLATGADFPDALSAATLATYHNCPILLVGDEMHLLQEYLSSKHYTDAFICGGSGAIPEDIINNLFK